MCLISENPSRRASLPTVPLTLQVGILPNPPPPLHYKFDSVTWWVDSRLFAQPKQNRWIFEKYDGVRGFWNPLKKTFFSRKGNAINIPKEITDTMPENLFLDGELWYPPVLFPPPPLSRGPCLIYFVGLGGITLVKQLRWPAKYIHPQSIGLGFGSWCLTSPTTTAPTETGI